MTDKPKTYEVVKGWVKCLAFFSPQEMTTEQFDLMSLEDRLKNADWTAFRFEITRVEGYYRSIYPGCTVVNLKSSNGHCVSIPIGAFDKIMELE